MTRLLIICAAGFITLSALGADIETAGQIFRLGAGARSDGLGGCGALLGEATSGLYNPAAQVLANDLAGTIFSDPRPHFVRGYSHLVLSASAHTEFGYVGADYFSRQGVDGSAFPPEEGSALILAGRPWRGLSVGFGIKVLSTEKANFIPLNETTAKTYKTAFDVGAVYAGLLPRATLHQAGAAAEDHASAFARPFPRGLSVGIAFQNLGGRVKYDYAVDFEMLPQTFRADLLWAAFDGRWGNARLVGEVEKLLVKRNANGGYAGATNALFTAWGSGDNQGGWTTRWGAEISALGLISGRIGWSVDSGANRSFTHLGIGLGPEWLRANFACVREPGSDFSWWDGLRLDATANVSYEQVRGWMGLGGSATPVEP